MLKCTPAASSRPRFCARYGVCNSGFNLVVAAPSATRLKEKPAVMCRKVSSHLAQKSNFLGRIKAATRRTQSSSTNAHRLNLSNGSWNTNNKTNSNYVRPVRR